MLRIFTLILALYCPLHGGAFAPAGKLTGTWQLSYRRLVVAGQTVTIKPGVAGTPKTTWQFLSNGKLIMTTPGNTTALLYAYANDTLTLTATNGHVTHFAVIKHYATALHLHLIGPPDDEVQVWKRVK